MLNYQRVIPPKKMAVFNRHPTLIQQAFHRRFQLFFGGLLDQVSGAETTNHLVPGWIFFHKGTTGTLIFFFGNPWVNNLRDV